MPRSIVERGRELAATRWLRGLWTYYRGYTASAIHTASAAALAIFGLLVFIDPLFAVVAIISYVGPPLVLYTLGAEIGPDSTDSERASPEPDDSDSSQSPTTGSNGTVSGDTAGDSDRKYGDTDTNNGDSDSDSDDGDSDSDSDDGDSDSDSDDGDTDSDS